MSLASRNGRNGSDIMVRPGISKERHAESRIMSLLSTKRVLRNLFIMVPTFYMTLFSISSIIHAMFGQSFHAITPFNFNECCLKNSLHQANGVSIIISFLLASFLFLFVTTIRLWDHITTIAALHILLASIVMMEFPLNWHWWVALGIGIISSVIVGEITAYFIQKKSS